ncbi:MAG: chalcone isomerase family protein [Pseudomonadota bacterium]
MQKIFFTMILALLLSSTQAAELSGVFIEEKIELDDDQSLILNGAGLRERLWFDIYVGSLYLTEKSTDVAEVLSKPGPLRIQLDFVYKEVSREKLLEAWRDGFEKNQSEASMTKLKARIEQFYAYFDKAAVAKDRYQFDYLPELGTRISINNEVVGTIPGMDFKNALVEIWLGNHPADKNLKRSMLGIW